MRSQASQELPSFGSDPFTTTWYRCHGKAAVCKGSTHTGVNCTHSLCGSQFQTSFHCFKWDTQVAELYHNKDLSGNERDNGRNKRKLAQGAFITGPWTKEPRTLALYQINLRKKTPPKSASFLQSLSLQSKQKQSLMNCGQSVPDSSLLLQK